MSSALHTLPWLVAADPEFRRKCRSLDETTSLGQQIAVLASQGQDANQLAVLSKRIAQALARGSDLTPLLRYRLGVVGGATTALFSPCLPASAARHGIALEVIEAPYGQFMQQAVDPNSTINSSCCDGVLVALDYRDMGLSEVAPGDAAGHDAAVAQAIDRLLAIRDGVSAAGAQAILQTVTRPPETLFGSYDIRLPGTPRRLAEDINKGIVTLAERTGDVVLDVAALAEQVGLWQWHDPVQWHLHKLPFAHSMVPLYCDHIGRLLGALRGRARKVAVFDLDNTLWGGVIGDDGLGGIRVGQGDGVAEAFLAVQRMALAWHGRGVVLAVCSKNDDPVARTPFREHPDMVLRESHFSVFQANWQDKASNLEAIARQLNLGLDALVFIDDNPVERAQVRAALPQVAVPELPEDPCQVPRLLAAAGYFEAVSFSDEDRLRNEQYRENSGRAQLLAGSRDLSEYLASLQMKATATAFDPIGRARIAQLINKTNQFNVTGRRYSLADVERMEGDPALFTLQVRLEDAFGDNGMVSVVIVQKGDREWSVDTWLMSCRVLGRRLEEWVLERVVDAAQAEGAMTLVGRYIPTGRNTLVEDLYQRLGFAKVEGGDAALWRLELNGRQPAELPIATQM
jgi:FkbH-like protein